MELINQSKGTGSHASQGTKRRPRLLFQTKSLQSLLSVCSLEPCTDLWNLDTRYHMISPHLCPLLRDVNSWEASPCYQVGFVPLSRILTHLYGYPLKKRTQIIYNIRQIITLVFHYTPNHNLNLLPQIARAIQLTICSIKQL